MEKPRGRAALLQDAARKLRETKPGGDEAQSQKDEEEPPKPRGRAALLERIKAVKLSPTATAIADITKSISTISVSEKSEPQIKISYKGSAGTPVYMQANYIKFAIDSNKGVFDYDVKFNPQVDARFARAKLVKSRLDIIGNISTYDGGALLTLPIQLPDRVSTFTAKHPLEDVDIAVTITFVKARQLKDCINLFNILLKRIMRVLKYERSGRNYYDPRNSKPIPQHRLDVLPGYACAIDEYEGGLLMCLDTEHRVLRTVSVIEYLMELPKEKYKAAATSGLIGEVVMTKYNNRTYRVDDILWDKKPTDTFETTKGPMSFVDYYKKQHGLDILALDQPLLLHKETHKNPQTLQEEEKFLCLIPEFCHLTGLSDAMRSDYRVMKDVAEFTRLTPMQRKSALNNYLRSVRSSPEAQKILDDWGLRLVDGLLDIEARVLDNNTIIFGGSQIPGDSRADWSNALGRNKAYVAVDLYTWILVFTKRDEQVAKTFAEAMPRLSRSMGCTIKPPRMICLQNDRTPTFVQALEQNIDNTIQCVTVIVPAIREDLYRAIKRITCVNKPTASQVIFARNLMNPKKERTITLRVALQINCKLGGSLWAVKIPVKTWMICGIDVFHSTGKKSMGAFVASTSPNFTTYFTYMMRNQSEIGDDYRQAMVHSLINYRNMNGVFPTMIVVFRDGVGDGQFKTVIDYEIEQLKRGAAEAGLENVKLCFIVVQKRINTRIIHDMKNPPPGTIVDSVITSRKWRDFYLVPQSVNQGTVSPTRYIVLYDSADLKVDHVQKLTFKMCHLYYNWAGTIRVPAVCQYAHKAAYMVGQYLANTSPADVLRDKLWYL